MPRILPPAPDLDQLKRQAKELLHAYRAGDVAAQRLIEQHVPQRLHVSSTRNIVLADMLMVIAREYGFTSWTKLKQHIATLPVERVTVKPNAIPIIEEQPRRSPRTLRIQTIAEQWLAFAEQQAIGPLLYAMAIPARDIDAARAYLVEQGTYTRIVDALLLGIESQHVRIRFLAAQAMDHFADQRCADALLRLLRDPVPRVRWAAIHSLRCDACKITPLTLETDIVALLFELATIDPSIRVRRVAAYELGCVCHDARAVMTLETLLAHETDMTIIRNARYAIKQQKASASSTET
jgi:hypothetical protein